MSDPVVKRLALLFDGVPHAHILSEIEEGDHLASGDSLEESEGEEKWSAIRAVATVKLGLILSADQAMLVQFQAPGPVLVVGGAGTGKSLVAIKRAEWLAKDEAAKVLLITPTADQQHELQSWANSICFADALRRIEVIRFDSWMNRLYKKLATSLIIVGPQDRQCKRAWRKAVSSHPEWPKAFLRQEYREVVLANGIENERDYLRTQRSGQGTPLTRRERRELWTVFHHYLGLLKEQGIRERERAFMDVCAHLPGDVVQDGYSAIVVDGGEELSPQAWQMIGYHIHPDSPNRLYIVADPRQRSLFRMSGLDRAGIYLSGGVYHLQENFRVSTPELTGWPQQVISGAAFNDFYGSSRAYETRKLAERPSPDIRKYSSMSTEIVGIAEYLRELVCDDHFIDACIIVRSRDRDEYVRFLRNIGLDARAVFANSHELPIRGICVATMSRIRNGN